MKLHPRATLLGLVAAVAAGPASAVNRCTIEGRVVFQDQPCPASGETVSQGLDRRRREEALHRKLDDLAARGVGLVTAPAPPPPAPRPPSADDDGRIRSRAELEARRQTQAAEQQARTLENNRQAAAQLTAIGDDMTRACGGPPVEVPVVGMSDRTFRECTLKARFGGVLQVVAVEHEGVPLRLYLFPNGPASRVYSIGGVITAVRP